MGTEARQKEPFSTNKILNVLHMGVPVEDEYKKFQMIRVQPDSAESEVFQYCCYWNKDFHFFSPTNFE